MSYIAGTYNGSNRHSLPMNPKVKADWLAALRGGDYKQGEHRLHKVDGGFCCLGVLCDLYNKEHAIGWKHGDEENAYSFFDELVYLPKQVAAWAGIDQYGMLRTALGPKDLAGMNDLGNSFDEIAEVIEEHL